MGYSLRTSWVVLRISIEERLVYRGDFALSTLMRFLPVVTQIFLWAAVFSSVGVSGGSSATIVGYSYQNMVAYYLMTMIARAFSSMPGLASGITRDIRDGTVKKYLIQPIDMLQYLLLCRIAHKLVYYAIALAPFALVYFLCRSFFGGWPDPTVMLGFVLSLILSFFLGFFLEATLGLVGFWFLEVNSLLFVYMLFNFFVSGHMFPLDMLPGVWGQLVKILPFQYMAYFPAAVFLGKIQGVELAWGLAIEAAWLAIFIVTARVLLHFGIKRYSGFGG